MVEFAVAVFSDVHSNLEALEAVIADMDAIGIRTRVCLGDIVGYAASPSQCLAAVRALNCLVLQGNHDALAAGDASLDAMRDIAKTGLEYSRRRLSVAEREYLRALPLLAVEGDMEFVHASLHQPADWTYLNCEAALQQHFKAQTRRISFAGHTHVPCTWHLGLGGEISPLGGRGRVELPRTGKILINVGAVGQPRDLCPDACYVIFEPDANCVEFRRVSYEISKTRRKISRAKLPRFAAQRLSLGR